MRTKGYFYVPDYEHQGDIDQEMSIVKQVDSSAKLLDTNIYREDPEADCDTCELTIEFDYSKINELRQVIQIFDWKEPSGTDDDITVYVTKTGKSYKLKQDRKWSIEKPLSEAINEGMYLYASKKK